MTSDDKRMHLPTQSIDDILSASDRERLLSKTFTINMGSEKLSKYQEVRDFIQSEMDSCDEQVAAHTKHISEDTKLKRWTALERSMSIAAGLAEFKSGIENLKDELEHLFEPDGDPVEHDPLERIVDKMNRVSESDLVLTEQDKQVSAFLIKKILVDALHRSQVSTVSRGSAKSETNIQLVRFYVKLLPMIGMDHRDLKDIGSIHWSNRQM